MPLSRSLSMSSLPGLEDWEDEFDPENAVLFEVAWEVANKGENASLGPLTEESSRGWGSQNVFIRAQSYVGGRLGPVKSARDFCVLVEGQECAS